MKIIYFKANNFAGIYAGTGRTEIEIDFKEKNINDIILLLGSNGCGKSSLMSIMHPFRETFDVRKNIILKEKDGFKEVHLQDKADVYIIRHHYGKTSSKNKSYISKNGVELNENGNITSFMDVLQERFNLSKDYFTIGKIGSNVEGFIGLSTANRKGYINKFIPNIDEYLEAFDIVNEKYKDCNKDIKSLKSSLEKIDEDHLLMKKAEIETEIKSLTETIKSFQREYTVAENNLANIREELKDIPEDLEELLLKAESELQQEKIKFEAYLTKYPKLEEYTLEIISDKINENKIEISKLEESSLNITNNITRLEDDKNSVNSEIVKNENLKEESYVNFIKPSEIKVDIFNENNERNAEKKNLQEVEEKLKELELLDFTQHNEYSIAKSESDRLMSTIQNIKDSYSLDLIETTNILEKDNYLNELKAKEILITKLKNELEEVKNKIYYLESNHDKYSKIYSQKPTDCVNTSCAFIKDANIFMTQEYPQYETLTKSSIELATSIVDETNYKDLLEERISYIFEINKYIVKDIENYKFLSLIVDFTEINLMMTLTTKLEGNLENILGLIKNYHLFSNNIIRLDNSIKNNEMLLETNTQKELLIKEYEGNIERLNEKSTGIYNEIHSLRDDKQKVINSITIKNNSNKLFDIFTNILTNYDIFEREYEKYHTLFTENQSKLAQVLTLENSLKNYSEEIVKNDNRINNLDAEIEKVKNQLFLFETYSDKLKAIEGSIQNLELVKDALDPKKGIPLIFMTNYLNIISASANKLLDKAYDGDFKISFHVTAKEFLISVYKSDGTVLNDISEASQGEVALTTIALSLAMMENLLSDCKYNILYLDEVDATLSTNNRRIFLELLKIQMEKNIEQCFVISHNDEFYSQPVDLVLFNGNTIDKDDKELMENKNVLWEI